MTPAPHDTNGRMKLGRGLAWTIALSLIGVGVAWGSVISGQAQMSKDISEIKVLLSEKYVSREVIAEKVAAAEKEHERLWTAIRALEARKTR